MKALQCRILNVHNNTSYTHPWVIERNGNRNTITYIYPFYAYVNSFHFELVSAWKSRRKLLNVGAWALLLESSLIGLLGFCLRAEIWAALKSFWRRTNTAKACRSHKNALLSARGDDVEDIETRKSWSLCCKAGHFEVWGKRRSWAGWFMVLGRKAASATRGESQ